MELVYGNNVQSISLEVQITATGGKYFLPDDATLRNKEIIGAFVPDNADGSAYSPLGRPLATNAAVRSSWLTLKEVSDDILSAHPLSDLLITSSDKTIRQVNFCGLNPQSSYILVGNTSLLTAGQSFVIVILYKP